MLSFASAALVCQYKGDAWEDRLRFAYYDMRNDSITNYAKVVIDEKGIPYVHYIAYNKIKTGDQYNATIVCNYALELYQQVIEKNDTLAKTKFLTCINWLEDHINYRDQYALYEFTWRQPYYDSVAVPWTCGLTSGRAMEAFTGAYRLFHSQKYLDLSMALLRGFYQPIQAGGFTYKEPTGWWYEEYADTGMHTPRVLDGHIFALRGVYKFWQLTKNDSAAFVVKQGILSLKNNLPAYDMGDGWSYYDAYKFKSDKKYHMLNTGLMKELGEITKDPVFDKYYHKWNEPLAKPYVYRIIKEKNRSGLLLFFGMSSIFFVVFYFLTFILRPLISKKSRL